MKKRKATHDGTCQACGRVQAATPYGIAAHGYTKQQGWWSGMCAGRGHLPLEQSTTKCDATIEFLRRRGRELQEMRPEQVRVVTIDFTRHHVTYHRTIHGAEDWTAFVSSPEGMTRRSTTWEQVQKNEAWKLNQQGAGMLAHAQHMEELKARVYGQPLKPRKVRSHGEGS